MVVLILVLVAAGSFVTAATIGAAIKYFYLRYVFQGLRSKELREHLGNTWKLVCVMLLE